MKLKFKLSSSQKFVLQVDNTTYGDLKSIVLAFISTTYDKELNSIDLSLNGKDSIEGNDSDLFSSLGIVAGDLLTILPSSDSKQYHPATMEPASCIAEPKRSPKETCSKSGLTGNVPSKPSGIESKPSMKMQCDDHQPLQYLVDAFSQYEPSSASQLVNLLVHVTMIRNGFHLDSAMNYLPPSWRDMATTLKYVHSNLENFTCTLVIVTMGDIKQILASFAGQVSEIGVKVNVNDYVDPSNPLTAHSIKRFDDFAVILKNNLLYPLQVAAHDVLGIPPPWHLAGLPQEIMIKIASFLNLRSLVNLGSTCKRMNSALDDPEIWFHLFKQNFPKLSHESDTITGANWKAKYKWAHSEKMKEGHHHDKTYVIPDPFNRPAFRPHFPNPINPLIPLHPMPNIPRMPFGMPNPMNPFGDPDSPYFQDDPPPPGIPGYPIMRPRGNRGPRIDFI